MNEDNALERVEGRIDRRQRQELRHDRSGGFSIWHAIGGLTLLGLAAMVIVTLPDIKRYIKISTM